MQAQVGEVRRFRVAKDAEDAAHGSARAPADATSRATNRPRPPVLGVVRGPERHLAGGAPGPGRAVDADSLHAQAAAHPSPLARSGERRAGKDAVSRGSAAREGVQSEI